MNPLIRINPSTRKVCFAVDASHCCDSPITEYKRFKVDVIKEGCCDDVMFTYPMFDVSDDGHMCILIDNSIYELCPGRYIFKIMFDECVIVAEFRFLWGARPVVTGAYCENSKLDDCFDETGTSENSTPQLPDVCCDPCEEEPSDPCGRFKPDCGCGEPTCNDCGDLLNRGCQ